jgi:hypothetical protein
VVISLAVLLLGTALAVGWWQWRAAKQIAPINSSGIDALAAKPTVIEADLTGLDKTEAFYAYMVNAAQQPKVVTRSIYYLADSSTAAHDTFERAETGYNYQTKKFIHAEDEQSPAGVHKTRCVNGQEFTMPGNLGITDWLPAPSLGKNTSACEVGTFPWAVSDGFNTGGLSASQAKTFWGYLKGKPGLITINDLKLSPHDGKQYLHFYADLKPVAYGHQKGNPGLQWLKLAFKKTGLNASTWPYSYVNYGGPFDGYHIEYWIDAHTKLPIHSEIHKLPGLGADGKPLADEHYYRYNTSFDFTTDTFDVKAMMNQNALVPAP